MTCLPTLKVLVVDDSAFMRKIIRDMLESDPEICVVGTAFDGLDALKKVPILLPDVITLDVEMPRLDGLGCLEQLMRTSPRPVVMLSSLTGHGSKATIEALMKGATDFLEKPSTHRISDLEAIRQELIAKVKNAGRARIAPPKTFSVYRETPVDKTLSKVPMRCLVAIGSSTGGPRALETVLQGLPSDLPAGIVITQHMPAGFTKSLAERLDRVCEIKVREATRGCRITSGVAYIAAGGYHMKITDNQTIEFDSGPPIAYVKPSVDFMMCSLASVFKERVIAVILTGMGRDGADGVKYVKEYGARVICQDEASSTIFGMPKAVIDDGNADEVLGLSSIADRIVELVYSIC